MKIFVRFDVFTAEKIYVFLWIMTPCVLVGDWKSFKQPAVSIVTVKQ